MIFYSVYSVLFKAYEKAPFSFLKRGRGKEIEGSRAYHSRNRQQPFSPRPFI
jgi:hypothetical protein